MVAQSVNAYNAAELRARACQATSATSLWGPMDCSPPGSSVRGTLQARILEWVAMPSSRGSSQPRDWTHVSCRLQAVSLPLSHQGSPTELYKNGQNGKFYIYFTTKTKKIKKEHQDSTVDVNLVGLQLLWVHKNESSSYKYAHIHIHKSFSIWFSIIFKTDLYNCTTSFLSFFFGCARSSLLCRLSSSCGEQRLLPSCDAWVSHCSGFSCCRAWVQEHTGFSSCGSQALEHWLSSCGTLAQLLWGTWNIPGPGIKPMSPTVAGGFFTTEPPGKLQQMVFKNVLFLNF